MRLLDEVGVKGTFLSVGWIGEKYPDLIRRLSNAGHEIGCHSYWHRLVYMLTPDEFRKDLEACLQILRELSQQPVTVFRAPGFSMKSECFWAYPILRENGIEIDVSIVPATRDHGGIDGFPRDPFQLRTSSGQIKVFPVSVWNVAGKTVPFSGGGYLRLFPLSLIKLGFSQNMRDGRPCMTYIHPREVNINQPRLKLPLKKYIKYYVGISTVVDKLRALLCTYRFTTVSDVLSNCEQLPQYYLDGDQIREANARVDRELRE